MIKCGMIDGVSTIVKLGMYLVFISTSLMNLVLGQLNWQWITESSQPNNIFSSGFSCSTDFHGNVYGIGTYRNSINFGSVQINTNSSAFNVCYFVKLNSVGIPIWGITPVHFNNTLSNGLQAACDNTNGVYFLGAYRDSIQIGNNILIAGGTNLSGYFLVKYDTSGNYLWSLNIPLNSGYTPNETPYMNVDNSGNVLICGIYPSLSLSVGNLSISTNRNLSSFLLKVSPQGVPLWLRGTNTDQTSGSHRVRFNSLDIGSDNAIYVAGELNGNLGFSGVFSPNISVPFSGNGVDMLIVKYDSLGNALWATRNSAIGNDIATGITIASDNNLYICGRFFGSSISFGSYVLNNLCNTSICANGFLLKADTAGNYIWAKSFASTGSLGMQSITSRDSPTIFVSGFFISDTVFYLNSILYPSTNSQSSFIYKLDTAGSVLCSTVLDSIFPTISLKILAIPPWSNDSSLCIISNKQYTSHSNSLIAKCSCGPDTLRASIGGTQTICSGYPGQALMQFSGAGPYSITYSDGTSNTTITGITNRYYFINATPSASVSYTLTAFSGASGPGPFSGMASIQVVQPPTANLSAAQTICQGDSVRLSVNLGGTGPWRFTYASGSGNLAATALTTPWVRTLAPTASFTWTVNNLNNFVCSGTSPPASPVTVGVRPGLNLSGGTVVCAEDSLNFSAALTGTQPWSLSYTNGTVSQTFTGLTSSPFVFKTPPAASTSFSLLGGTGCSRDTIINRILPPILQVSHTATAVSCFGGSNGIGQGSATGGGGTYNFVWNTLPAQSSATATGLAATSWIVSVTDNLGCLKRDTALITQPPQLTATVTTTPLSCFGQSNATATAMGSGGTGAYSYSWNTNPVQTTQTASGLSATTWTVTITDQNACTAQSSIPITSPPPLLLNTTATPVSCFGGSDGAVAVAANGGTPGYAYSWNTNPIRTTATVTGLNAGSYTVTVTDNQGCTAQAGLVVMPANAPIQISSSFTAVSCFGGSNGTASTNASGGSGGFSFSWNTNPIQSTQNATGLSAGSWILTVSDQQNCSRLDTVTIPQPPALSTTVTHTLLACFGSSQGQATASVNGGTTPYTYTWNTNPIQTTLTATGLSAGTWQVQILDANACADSAQVILTEPPLLTLSSSSTAVSCFGGSNGTATTTASGGTAPYTYSWNTNPIQTTAMATGLTAGTWTVTVTDANQCQQISATTITQPSIINLFTSFTAVQCFGGSNGTATAQASGGTAPYIYTWSTTPIQTSTMATGLRAGTYSIQIQDAQNCQTSTTLTIPQPAALGLNSLINPVSCPGGNDGSATIAASGGNGPYSYTWNTVPVQTGQTGTGLSVGTWGISITDASGCRLDTNLLMTQPPAITLTQTITPVSCLGRSDGGISILPAGGNPPYTCTWNTTPVQSGFTATGLSQQFYLATITDNRGCTHQENISVPTQAPIQIQIFPQPTLCDNSIDGTASINITGGTPGYTYSWSTTPIQTLTTATGLSPGTWQVVVTDSRACMDSATTLITSPTALQVTATANDVSCFGLSDGAASGSFSGGTPPYSYSWNTTPLQTTQAITGIPAGIYNFTVNDANGCSHTASVVVRQPTALSGTLNPTQPLCHGGSDGSIGATISGGIAPYSYLWTGGQTSTSIFQLTIGSYSLTVTDANACTLTLSTQLTEPSPLQANITGFNLTCLSPPNNGAASVNPTGGTAPYTYLWTGGSFPTQANNTGFAAGTWSVQVLDDNNCMTQASVVLHAPQRPTAHAGRDTFFCAGSGGIQIQGLGQGGQAPYSFQWSPNNGSLSNANAPNPIANPDSITVYYLIVTDAAGCSSVVPDQVVVSPIDLPLVDAGPDEDYCLSGPAVFISGSVTNPASGGYSWQWLPSTGLFCDTCPTTYASPNITTIYTLTVTHLASGCSSDSTTLNTQSSVTITVKPRPIVYAGLDTTICPGDTATLCATSTGVGPVYTYEWSPNVGMNDSTLQCPGVSPNHSIYYFVVATSEGCESPADSVLVSVAPMPTVEAGNVKNICQGDSIRLDGQIQGGVQASIQWSPSNGLNAATLLQPNASPAGSQWYYLHALNAGCVGPKDSVFVVVHPVPVVDAGNDTSLCLPYDTLRLQGIVTGVSPPLGIEWSPSGGLSATNIINPFTTANVSTLYYLKVTSGVAPTLCSAYDSVFINISPEVQFTLEADTNVLCGGDSVRIQAISNNSNIIYNWSPSNYINDISGNGSLVYTQPDTSIVLQVVGTEGACNNRDSIFIQVHPKVRADFTQSQSVLCRPDSVVFLNLSANAILYQWHFGDSSGIENTPNPNHFYHSPGSYTPMLIGIGLGGCRDTAYGTIPIQIQPILEAQVVSDPVLPLELTLPAGGISLTATSGTLTHWHWDMGDGTQYQQGAQVHHTFIKPGTYYLTLTAQDSNACEVRWKGGPIIIKLPELFIPNVFSPNGDGIGDYFRIEYEGNESYHLTIIDRWGVTQFDTHNPQKPWDGRDLNGSAVSEGVYFYVVQIGEKRWQGSVTVAR